MTIHNFRWSIFERKKIMELELNHLAPYLPYGLKVLHTDWNAQLNMTATGSGNDDFSIEDVAEYAKPILRPMSDLTKSEHITKIGYRSLSRNGGESYTLSQYEYLFENHFDVFGLITAGLAININTVD